MHFKLREPIKHLLGLHKLQGHPLALADGLVAVLFHIFVDIGGRQGPDAAHMVGRVLVVGIDLGAGLQLKAGFL